MHSTASLSMCSSSIRCTLSFNGCCQEVDETAATTNNAELNQFSPTFDCLVSNRNLIRMNSDDSLNQGVKHTHTDLYQQGAELVDSPRDSAASTSTCSPASIRHEMSGMHMTPVIFDPNTGQQYYLPTHQPSPQMFYQPMYVPTPGAMYYPPPYTTINTAIPPPPPTANQYYIPPMQFMQHTSPPRMPSSTNVPSSSCAHCHQHPLSHTPRTTASATGFSGDMLGGSRESSPDYGTPQPPPAAKPFHAKSITITETTESRTPLFGQQPAWWGQMSSKYDEKNTTNDHIVAHHRSAITTTDDGHSPSVSSSTTNTVAPTLQTTHHFDSDTPLTTVSSSPPAGFASRRSFKPIRMDIDFDSRLESPPKQQQQQPLSRPIPDYSKPSGAVATAFTVSFDCNDDKLNLQAAARKSTTGRRMMRRSACSMMNTTIGDQQHDMTTDSKQYLLNKLLNGDDNQCQLMPGATLNTKRDIDSLSDAGTYVIDRNEDVDDVKDRNHMMLSSQILDDDEEEDNSRTPSPLPSEKTVSSSFAGVDNRLQQQQRDTFTKDLYSKPVQKHTPIVKSTAPTHTLPPSPYGVNSTTVLASGAKSRRSEPLRPSTSTAVVSNRYSLSNTGVSSTKPTSSGSAFRRGDGGRFSMRGGGGHLSSIRPPPLPTTTTKPPFKPGANVRSSAAKDSAEMAAWLRRKDYNPMKAAADAKQRIIGSRSDQFCTNRSLSFHVGDQSKSPIKSRRLNGANAIKDGAVTTNALKNKSHDDLLIGWDEDSDSVACYSREIVNDLTSLTILENQTSIDTQLMQHLTEKSAKAIQLIRSSGMMSKSLEQLIGDTSSQGDDESMNSKLNRLSNTLDAVNRVLEMKKLTIGAGGYRSRLVNKHRSPSITRE